MCSRSHEYTFQLKKKKKKILSAPKRSSKFFAAWVRNLKVKIEVLKKSGRSIIFSDGAYWSKTARSSYAFTAFHNNTWVDHYGWCPAGSSYNSEIAALEEAIQWAVVHCISDPVFLVDNKAVLTTFLNLTMHSSQMLSIRINALIHDFLSTTNNSMSFGYCPSHIGIDGNERADKLTKTGATMGPTPPARMLQSNFINNFKREMTTHWRVLSLSQTYKGRNWLPIRRKRRMFKPSVGSRPANRFFLTMSGNDIETLSRMAHAITGHAPMGEYRQRFHPDLPTHCKHCGPNTEHMRAIFYFLALCTLHLPLHLLIGNTTG